MIYLGTYPLQGRNRSSDDVLSQSEEKKKVELSMDAWSSWNYKEDQLIRVVFYTNAPKARLLLNGKPFRDTKNYDHKTGIIYWDVPYQQGELKAEGLDDSGAVLSTYRIQTSATANAMKVISKVNNKEENVSQVAIQIVDAKGVPVTYTDSEITCTILGNGTLLGLEAGDNRDMSDYTDNKQKTFRGRLIAYIKTSGKGITKVVFSVPQLKDISVEL